MAHRLLAIPPPFRGLPLHNWVQILGHLAPALGSLVVINYPINLYHNELKCRI
jgi:hypothetical protein